MKTENLVIMKELLKRLENMTPEEYENFQPEGLAVARATLVGKGYDMQGSYGNGAISSKETI